MRMILSDSKSSIYSTAHFEKHFESDVSNEALYSFCAVFSLLLIELCPRVRSKKYVSSLENSIFRQESATREMRLIFVSLDSLATSAFNTAYFIL